MNGAQRKAWMMGIRAKTRNDLARARGGFGVTRTHNAYPNGSIMENIRACSTAADIETVTGWVALAKDASPATRRKWIAAIEDKRAEILAGADA